MSCRTEPGYITSALVYFGGDNADSVGDAGDKKRCQDSPCLMSWDDISWKHAAAPTTIFWTDDWTNLDPHLRGLPRIRESWHKLLARIPWMAWSKSCLDSSGAWIHLDSYGLSSYFCYFYGEFICCLKHCKSRDTWRCLDMMFKFVAQPFSHLMPLCFRDFWGAPSRGYFLGVFLMLGIGLLSLTRAVSLDLMKVLGFPFGRSTVWGIQRELFFDVFVTILGKSQFSVKSIVHVYFNIYIHIIWKVKICLS